MFAKFTPDDIAPAQRLADHIRRQIEPLALMIDDLPGRNVRWEIHGDISRLASLIGPNEATGRILEALSLELESDFIDPYTAMPQAEKDRRRKEWEKIVRKANEITKRKGGTVE